MQLYAVTSSLSEDTGSWLGRGAINPTARFYPEFLTVVLLTYPRRLSEPICVLGSPCVGVNRNMLGQSVLSSWGLRVQLFYRVVGLGLYWLSGF